MSSAIHFSQLRHLLPLLTFPRAQLIELAQVARVEEPADGALLFESLPESANQLLYLLAGSVSGVTARGIAAVIDASTPPGAYPLNDGRFDSVTALADAVVVSLPLDLVDVLATWDQLSVMERRIGDRYEHFYGRGIPRRWRHGFFPALRGTPAARIEELMQTFEPVATQERQLIAHQGEELTEFYVIDGGSVLATRESPADEGESIELSQLGEGECFGAEALGPTPVSSTTASMISDGMLLRLRRADFVRLQDAPPQALLSAPAAIEAINNGARWLDVRQRGEWQHAHLPGALNVPLQEIRLQIAQLDPAVHYVCYCNSGRRAAAAAYTLTQHGFNAGVLDASYRAIS